MTDRPAFLGTVERRIQPSVLLSVRERFMESAWDKLDVHERGEVEARLTRRVRDLMVTNLRRDVGPMPSVPDHEVVLHVSRGVPADGEVVVAAVLRTTAIEWELQGDQDPDHPGIWEVVGHPELGLFASELAAISMAWAVTPPGVNRPRVRETS